MVYNRSLELSSSRSIGSNGNMYIKNTSAALDKMFKICKVMCTCP
jgi:hypothetical protein